VHLLLSQSILGAGSNFAEVGFFHFIHHPKLVIPTGGTAVLAVPERRNPSTISEFRLGADEAFNRYGCALVLKG
jgi:hypothetical protein